MLLRERLLNLLERLEGWLLNLVGGGLELVVELLGDDELGLVIGSLATLALELLLQLHATGALTKP